MTSGALSELKYFKNTFLLNYDRIYDALFGALDDKKDDRVSYKPVSDNLFYKNLISLL